jgi:hypothetical protein
VRGRCGSPTEHPGASHTVQSPSADDLLASRPRRRSSEASAQNGISGTAARLGPRRLGSRRLGPRRLGPRRPRPVRPIANRRRLPVLLSQETLCSSFQFSDVTPSVMSARSYTIVSASRKCVSDVTNTCLLGCFLAEFRLFLMSASSRCALLFLSWVPHLNGSLKDAGNAHLRRSLAIDRKRCPWAPNRRCLQAARQYSGHLVGDDWPGHHLRNAGCHQRINIKCLGRIGGDQNRQVGRERMQNCRQPSRLLFRQ